MSNRRRAILCKFVFGTRVVRVSDESRVRESGRKSSKLQLEIHPVEQRRKHIRLDESSSGPLGLSERGGVFPPPTVASGATP